MENKRFTKSVFSNPIDLTKLFTDDRYVDYFYLTSSIMAFSDTYFLTSKGNGIFKTFSGDTCLDYRSNRMINELLCYKLGKQTSCPCADGNYATYKTSSGKIYDGILSYETQRRDDNIYYATDFLGLDIEDGKNGFVKKFMEKWQQKLPEDSYNKEQTLRMLYKIVVFDLLTMQCDRHMENVHIIKKDGQNFYYISPLIDNEYAFLTRHFEQFENMKNITKQDLINAFNKETFPSIEEIKNPNDRYNETIKQIVSYAKKYPMFDEDLKFMLNNVNINKAFLELESEGIMVDNDYKKMASLMLNMTKQKIKEEYQNNKTTSSLKTEENSLNI